MPSAFNFSASPFDCLTSEEKQKVRDSVDVAYFPEGEVILDHGAQPSHLYIIIKGYVHQLDGDEVVSTYGPDDTFDGRGLVGGRVSSRFVAAEEVVAYLLAKQTVSELISDNATFGALLFSDLSNKLSALSERHSQHELQSLTMAQVQEAFLRPVHVVDGQTDIYTIVETFHNQRTSNVLVRDARSEPPRMGIFTTTGLQRAILHGTPLKQLPVAEVATFPIVTVEPTDHVFDALTAMIRYKVHRLVVADGERMIGVLEQLDLLSFLSNHSHLISLQIADAQDIPTLMGAAEQITRLIMLLHRGGTRVSQIAKLVQELNARLFERTWQLIAPRELVANSCLFVMGSEGRGEQVLKTDQDNGLVLRDGYVPPDDLEALCDRFSAALIDFGYPECPGRIMVNNPQWRHPAGEFGKVVRGWLTQPSADSLMSLAIFLDAHAVSGDATLLESVRGEVFKLVSGSDAMLGRFAASIDAFSNTSGWWNKLLSLGVDEKEKLDLKKAGVFPLVHGVRAMALAQRLDETSTVARIEELVKLHKLPPNVGKELTDALHFFMALKLKSGLAEMETGKAVSGTVDPDKLSPLDRDLLKDALGAVKRFKAMLRHAFHMETL